LIEIFAIRAPKRALSSAEIISSASASSYVPDRRPILTCVLTLAHCQTRGGPEHALDFETTIILPKSKNDNEPLQIKNFETDVPNIRHKIGDLRGLVDFQHISLKSSNAPIHVNVRLFLSSSSSYILMVDKVTFSP
jgi:hypothetical protein